MPKDPSPLAWRCNCPESSNKNALQLSAAMSETEDDATVLSDCESDVSTEAPSWEPIDWETENFKSEPVGPICPCCMSQHAAACLRYQKLAALDPVKFVNFGRWHSTNCGLGKKTRQNILCGIHVSMTAQCEERRSLLIVTRCTTT